MAAPISLGLIYGGASPEHEVSVRSARNIFAALDPDRYRVALIGVSTSGGWHAVRPEDLHAHPVVDGSFGQALILAPGTPEPVRYADGSPGFPRLDAVFPIVHGPTGEDGSLQGLLRLLGLPFVGPGVLGSAVCMDKDVTKRLLRDADLLVADYLCFHAHEAASIDYAAVVNQLGLPLFIKPANMGSSVGVRKASDVQRFREAVAEAFRYDRKILVESFIEGRELECAVMGNAIAETTGVGEVVMGEGFYDYDSKYISATAAEVQIPAAGLDAELLAKLRLVAHDAYRVLGCEGMARVDMFCCEDGRVYVNEVNTLPGFTSISMYPKLWEAAGIGYGELLDHLVALALDRARQEAALKTSRH